MARPLSSFPLGPGTLTDRHRRRIGGPGSGARGLDGRASVVSAVLATLLVIELGFTAVVALAVVLYSPCRGRVAARRCRGVCYKRVTRRRSRSGQVSF